MASFGGVNLGTRGAAVFEVTSESDDEEFVYPLQDGSEVVIPATSRYIVVRHCAGADFDEAY
ncbi:MAG TPA: hypothetical protein VFZ72_03340 [Jiangellaceae bacterium]